MDLIRWEVKKVKNDVIIPWLDFGVKYMVLIFSMYYLFMRCVSEKHDVRKMTAYTFFSVAMGLFLFRFRLALGETYILMMFIYFALTNCLLYRKEIESGYDSDNCIKLRDISLLSLICFAFCEALFLIVGIVSSTMLSVFYYNFVPQGHNSVWDFLNNKPVHTAAYVLMISMVWVTTYLVSSVKRLRQGLMNIVRHSVAGTAAMLAMFLLAVVMTFNSVSIEDDTRILRTILFNFVTLFCVVMVFFTKREIRSDYISQIRKKNLTLMEEILEEKNKEIAKVAKDNEKLAGIIRCDSELLGTVIDGLRTGENSEGMLRAAQTVEEIYSGRCEAVANLESCGISIEKTGVSSVDNVLLYMACKAEKKGVDFSVSTQPEVVKIFDEKIDRRTFNTILADLADNAIISARSVEAKFVEVRLLDIEDKPRLEVLDSGENFKPEVLKNLGRRRITTHANDGGSGIGLMNLFGIMKQTQASFTIEEYPCDGSRGKYTKALSVTFDGAGKYRIISYRADQLKREVKGRFEIIPTKK